MKRKCSMLMMLVISVFLFSGCIKSELNIKINDDQSGSYEIVLEVDKEMFEAIATISSDNADDFLEEGVKDLVAQGYTVKTNDKGDVYAIDYGKDFSDISELEIENFLDEDDTVIADYTEGNSGSNSLKFTMDNLFINEEFGDLVDSEELFDLFSKDMEVKAHITLPSKPISHNASDVKGNTLTWDIIELSKESDDVVLEMEYKDSGGFAGTAIIIVLVAFVAIGVFFFLRRKQSSAVED